MCNTNNPINNVRDHRKYWDGFVNQWKQSKNSNAILCWADPDSNPKLLNDPSNNNDLSSLYLPEPWWGNDGKDRLESVVININPGEGGYLQQKGKITFNTYSEDVVKYNKLCLIETAYWHWKRRGKPIHEALNLQGTCLNNHLSIELLPWHTQGTTSSYWKYLYDNIDKVYRHNILFAAEESIRIQNPCLKNVVILRINGNKTYEILKTMYNGLIGVGICIQNKKTINNGMYLKFKITDINNPIINDVTFVSIWGSNCWNNYPNNLKVLLNDICSNKTVHCDTLYPAKK